MSHHQKHEDAGNGADLSPEAALKAHLRDLGVTEEEIETFRTLARSGFAAAARTNLRPTAKWFRELITPKPSTRPAQMAAHPLADLFPVIALKDLEALAEDLKQNGQHDPIITLEGKILDGRHRYQACQMVGVEPRFEEFTGADPTAYVVSKNLHRRHLTASQRAVIANQMATRPHGDQSNAQICASSLSQDQAAELLQVSRRAVQDARRVAREAPELVEPIRHGDMTINAALEKIRPAKAEPVVSLPATTTPTNARELLLASAASPEGVQTAITAVKGLDTRDRLIALAEIMEDFPDRAARRKFIAYLTQQFR